MNEILFTQEIDPHTGNLIEIATVYNSDGSLTQMLKSTWDELQAKQTEGSLK